MILALRQRPLLLPFCAFAAGIASAVTCGFAITPLFLFLLPILVLFSVFVPRSNLPFLIILSLSLFAGGNMVLRPVLDNLRNDKLLLDRHQGRQMLVEGVVIRRPDAKGGGIKLQIRPEHVFSGDGRISLQGDILLRVGEGGRHLTTGDRVRFMGKLKTPRNFGIPGEFNSERYLAMKRVSATSFVQSEKDLLLMGRTHGSPLKSYFDNTAINIGEFITNRVPGTDGAIIKALLVGDDGDIPQELQNAYSRTGVNHILSISGFHVGIIALVLFQFWFALSRLVPWLLIYLNFRKVAFVASLPLVLYYLFLSGTAPATSRSVLMLGFVIIGMLLERETDHFNSLLLAASLLLLADPAALYDISFQLSFLALWGIIVLTPVFSTLFIAVENTLGRKLLQFFALSLAAVAVTLVPVAYYFQQATLTGLVSNFIIVPLLGYGAVVTGFSALPLIWVSTTVAGWLLMASAELVKISNWFILQLDRLPLAAVYTPSALDMALLLAGLLVVTLLESKRKKLSVIAAVTVLLLVMRIPVSPAAGGLLKLDFLSVGQGESTLITFRDGKRMLIDGGGSFQENGWDVGERLLIPALRKMGVEKVDYLVLSHAHPDHLQGVRGVAETLPIGEFWETGLSSESDDYRRLKTAISRKNVPVRIMNSGTLPIEISGVRVTFLYPPLATGGGDANESSMVMRLDAGEFSALFTGDIGFSAESRLLASSSKLGATLLKVPHHGSRHSVLPEFFRAVSPQIALIGAGYGNSFGLPSGEALGELTGLGCETYRTDLDGTVTVIVAGNGENHVISTVNRHFN